MPTIVLRHVTLRGDPQHSDQAAVRQTAAVGTSEEVITLHTAPMHTRSEQAERENIIDDLSLTIRNGETLSILGPSGCGKTTLLKVIAGLIKPDSGEILYDSKPIHETPMAERGIGMVFQTYALYPHLEARDNIGFYDLIRKQPEKIPERIRNIVAIMGVEIEHLLSRKPPTLSGGEQQRIAIARCLARDPQLFLFDEPLSNLDAKLRVETRVQLKRLLRHYSITSVYVTHDQTEAIALAHRIAIMSAGKIVQSGSYHALYNTPTNAFIAQFFGSPAMNLFPGRAYQGTWRGKAFAIGPIRSDLTPGKAVLLGVRPEHISLAEPDTGIPADVELVEPIFTQQRQLVYMRIAGQRCTASIPVTTEIRPHSRIYVDIAPQNVHLFDQQTGTRIG
jgi:multiple sugar transport system ATP-binding protein